MIQFLNYTTCRLSSGFYNWIKGNRKTCRTEQYVGCSYKELLDHLESQFDEGMTWENHGRGDGIWHIDHIKAPVAFRSHYRRGSFQVLALYQSTANVGRNKHRLER